MNHLTAAWKQVPQSPWAEDLTHSWTMKPGGCTDWKVTAIFNRFEYYPNSKKPCTLGWVGKDLYSNQICLLSWDVTHMLSRQIKFVCLVVMLSFLALIILYSILSINNNPFFAIKKKPGKSNLNHPLLDLTVSLSDMQSEGKCKECKRHKQRKQG